MRQWDKMVINIKDIKRTQDTVNHLFKVEVSKVCGDKMSSGGRAIAEFVLLFYANIFFIFAGMGYQPQQVQY